MNKTSVLKILSAAFLVSALSFSSCKKKGDSGNNTVAPPIDSTTNVMGYNMLTKLPGIWSGGVTSTTVMGNFSNWTLDFRPISASQVSGKSEYDSLNDIFLSFFIVRHNGQYKMAFRNGGSWAGMKRITYEIIDSVYETSGYSYYRFADFVKGETRTFYTVEFSGDSMYQKAYTNKYNTQPSAVLHMAWSSKRLDATSTAAAISHFSFPQKTMVKDFTHAFDGHPESVWYSFDGDPYAEAEQPYLGKAQISFSFAGSLSVDPNKKVFILLTTQPLFSGVTYNASALNYLSRYIIVKANYSAYTFTYFHPGTYYLYALYDTDGNGIFSSGDYVSFSNTSFTCGDKQTVSASTQINLVVP
jgi:hypothetical protein